MFVDFHKEFGKAAAAQDPFTVNILAVVQEGQLVQKAAEPGTDGMGIMVDPRSREREVLHDYLAKCL